MIDATFPEIIDSLLDLHKDSDDKMKPGSCADIRDIILNLHHSVGLLTIALGKQTLKTFNQDEIAHD